MTITLPQSQIKEFLKLSSYVVSDQILIDNNPNYGCIKVEIVFGMCFLSKTNQSEFVQFSFPIIAEDTSFLIWEEHLKSLMEVSKKENIRIELKLEHSTQDITDDYFTPKFGKQIGVDIKTYPKIPKPPKVGFKLTKRILDVLSVAKDNIEKKDNLRPFMNHVHIRESFIWATDGYVNFTYEFPEVLNFPLISLSELECNLISGFDECDIFLTDSFNIIKYKNCLYASRIKVMEKDMTDLLLKFKSWVDKSKFVKVQVKDFKDFCASTVSFTKKIQKNFKNSGLKLVRQDTIQFFYKDSENEIENVLEFPCVSIGLPDGYSFLFSHSRFLKVLDKFAYKEICLSDSENPTGGAAPFGIWIEEDGALCITAVKMTM